MNKESAQHLTDCARTDTVTEELLIGSNEYTGEFVLYDDPPIAHLEPDEQPHAILFNDLKGVGIDAKRNTITPDGRASSVFIFTDQRLLLLVGQRDGDWVRSVQLDAITDSEYHTGLMKHRVVVHTQETTYHLWVDASYEKRALEATVSLIDSADDRSEPTASTDTGPSPSRTAIGDGTGLRTAPGDEKHTESVNKPDRTPSVTKRDRTPSADSSGTNDPLETLERLKDLQENGVITDEEFQAKKAELLDQI